MLVGLQIGLNTCFARIDSAQRSLARSDAQHAAMGGKGQAAVTAESAERSGRCAVCDDAPLDLLQNERSGHGIPRATNEEEPP